MRISKNTVFLPVFLTFDHIWIFLFSSVILSVSGGVVGRRFMLCGVCTSMISMVVRAGDSCLLRALATQPCLSLPYHLYSR